MKFRDALPILAFVLAWSAGFGVSDLAKTVGWLPSLGLAIVCIGLGVVVTLEARR